MRLGLIARADFGRGLANQTYSFWKHLEPEVTVVVDVSPIPSRTVFTQDLDAYPGGIVTTWAGKPFPFANPAAIEALRTCDVIYSAETPYDPRVQDLNLVLHVNPELFEYRAAHYWYPTTWRIQDLPPGEIVPTPLADEDIALEPAGMGHLLHVAGHYASGDRNGTGVIGGVVGMVKHPWVITTQDSLKMLAHNVEIRGDIEDRWSLYDGASILAYPRRYGGQSLQVNEAMARGLAVVMSDVSPNIDTWPIIPVPTRPGGMARTPVGSVPTAMTQTVPMADVLTALLNDPDMLDRWQARSLMWARDNAWSQQKPRIIKLLEDAAG